MNVAAGGSTTYNIITLLVAYSLLANINKSLLIVVAQGV